MDKEKAGSLLRAVSFMAPDVAAGTGAYHIALSGFVGSIAYDINGVKIAGNDSLLTEKIKT